VGKAGTSDTLDPFGVGGGLDLHIGSILKLGGGGTHEHGTNLYVPLVGTETIDGAGKLRDGAGFYAHAMVTLGSLDLSAGFGQAMLNLSDFDKMNNLNINKSQRNIYGAIQYHFGPLTYVAELNLLHHDFHLGNKQDVTV